MLTDTKLRALKPRMRPYRVADSRGLCIEVRPTGTKAWRYRYRYAGKPSIITLDEYPVMSLMQARIERDRLRSLLRGGANPAQVARIERAAQMERSGTTFGVIAEELLKKRAKEGLSPGSVKRERRLIEKDLAPIADLPVADVSAPVLHVASFDTMMALVSAGYGVGFANVSLLSRYKHPEVIARPRAGRSAVLTTYLLRPDVPPSEQLGRFIGRVVSGSDDDEAKHEGSR